jgi:rRNA-processing protein FCF1
MALVFSQNLNTATHFCAVCFHPIKVGAISLGQKHGCKLFACSSKCRSVWLHQSTIRTDSPHSVPEPTEPVPKKLKIVASTEEMTLVVDTNVLINHLEFLTYLKNISFVRVVIPFVVVQELDKLKTRKGEIGEKAFLAIKVLYGLISHKQERDWVLIQQSHEITDNNGTLQFKNNDDNILGVALYYHLENKRRVILVTNDIGLRIKTHFVGVKTHSPEELSLVLPGRCSQTHSFHS